MKPWRVLERATTPGGTELVLSSHPSEMAILADGHTLMTSRAHDSEAALAFVGCRRARTLATPRVLVAGLGMGFTLRATLDQLPPAAFVTVAELVPAVVEWNRGVLGPLAAHPLDDPRVVLHVGHVATAMQRRAAFDAVLFDVDNGPNAMTDASNAGLYDAAGIAAVRRTLRPDGVWATWSARDVPAFSRRLRQAGFAVTRERVPARHGRSGTRHAIVVASLSSPASG